VKCPTQRWAVVRAPRHRLGVHCEGAREAISARLDGERSPLPVTSLDDHLATCRVCREFEAGAQALRREAGLRETRAVPAGLVATLVPLIESEDRRVFALHRRCQGSWRPRLAGARVAHWAAAIMPVVAISVAVPLGVGMRPRLVPSRPATPCTIGLVARHLASEGSMRRASMRGG